MLAKERGEEAPRVMLCHGSEDKPFVRKLAERLLSDGVAVWLDEWEVLPGDSLVMKIFDEAIGKCDAFMVVLSRTSVGKRWVQEELSAAVVRRISRDLRLIPIRLDDVDVPVALESTARVSATSGDISDADYQRILSAIYNEAVRPALGPRPPRFAQLSKVGRYSIEDTKVLRLVLEKQDPLEFVQDTHFKEFLPELDGETVVDSLEQLERDGVLRIHTALTTDPYRAVAVILKPYGWMTWAHVIGIDARQDEARVLAYLASQPRDLWVKVAEMAEALSITPVRMNFVLEWLDLRGDILMPRCAAIPYVTDVVQIERKGRRRVR